MQVSNKLWQAIEEVPGTLAAMAEWRYRLGSDFELIRSLLVPIDRLADILPVEGDPYALYRVVRHNDNDIVGIHDRDGSTIKLSKQDILIYRLDHQKLLQDVAALLGIKYAPANVSGIPHTYRLGSYCPFTGHNFPVFLTIPLECRDLQAATEVITTHCSEPFILLAPTSNRMCPGCEELIKARKALFLALSDAIDLSERCASIVAKECFDSFVREVVPQSRKNTCQPIFFPTPPNATWPDVKIKFTDGEAVNIQALGASGQYLYSDMGMVDGRNKKPDKQWQLLRAFARGFGSLTWETSDADSKNQKRREILAKKLKTFFRIDGDPIQYVEKTKGWQTLFTVEPDF